jgi:hypothetical protein
MSGFGDLYNVMIEVSKLKSELADIRRSMASSLQWLSEDEQIKAMTPEKRQELFNRISTQMTRFTEIVGT